MFLRHLKCMFQLLMRQEVLQGWRILKDQRKRNRLSCSRELTTMILLAAIFWTAMELM